MNRIILTLLSILTVFSACNGLAATGAGVIFNINPLSRFIGSFGGDLNCSKNLARNPVILIHGNADSSIGWTKEVNGQPSFIEQLKAAGYTNCDIYAVSYLSIPEQLRPSRNYHELKKMKFIKDYIETVMKQTGRFKVDIVAHSLGVTLSLETLHRFKMFKYIRKFVSIAGAMRGLQSCIKSGPANPSISTCGAVINKKTDEFGFWPDGIFGISNRHMGDSLIGFAQTPSQNLTTSFYAISAGLSDEVICADQQSNDDSVCQKSSYFNTCTGEGCNLLSQVLIGKAPSMFSILGAHRFGGDIADGIGHGRARDLSGSIVSEMLLTDCQGIQCCANYKNSCVEKPQLH